MNLSQAKLQQILTSQPKNIRTLLKNSDEAGKKKVFNNIVMDLLGLANTYTQSRFSLDQVKQKNSPEQIILLASAELVKNKFAGLSFFDLREAFEMYAAQQLDTDAKTYYGKFDAMVLGKILSSYKRFRDKAIFEYNKLEMIDIARQEDIKKEEKNQKAIAKVLQSYQDLKQKFNATGNIEEDSIKHYWAEILMKKKAFQFITDAKQKAEIWKEAKQLAEIELKHSIHSSKYLPAEKVSFKKSLETIASGGVCEKHSLAAKRLYSELLIKKSIIN